MLKLGTPVREIASDITGILVVYQTDTSGNEHYMFQPGGLNPETEHPRDTYWIGKNRIIGGVDIDITLPREILNTEVEDEATGFKGIAIQLYYHLNGCIHFDVKPKGTNKKTGETLKAVEFDIRRLKGAAIKKQTKAELEQSKILTPSPEKCHPVFEG